MPEQPRRSVGALSRHVQYVGLCGPVAACQRRWRMTGLHTARVIDKRERSDQVNGKVETCGLVILYGGWAQSPIWKGTCWMLSRRRPHGPVDRQAHGSRVCSSLFVCCSFLIPPAVPSSEVEPRSQAWSHILAGHERGIP
nr:hypothetical protein CFP56_22450 [Quercus suber]